MFYLYFSSTRSTYQNKIPKVKIEETTLENIGYTGFYCVLLLVLTFYLETNKLGTVWFSASKKLVQKIFKILRPVAHFGPQSHPL